MSASSAATPSTLRLWLGLGLAWLAVSSSAVVIVQAAPIPPNSIAAGRVAITALCWLTLWRAGRAKPRGSTRPCSSKKRGGLLLLAGLFLGLHFAAWVGCLSHTSVTRASVIVAVQPLWAGLLGRFLGDRSGWPLVAGTAVALSGTYLLSRATGADAGLLGDSMALFASLAAAVYLLAGRSLAPHMELAPMMAAVHGIGFVLLVAFVLATGEDPWPPEAGRLDLTAVLWLGLVPGLVGHGLLNWSARHLPVHVVSLAVLLEPAGAALLAYLWLGDRISRWEVLGGLLLMAGAGLALLGERRQH